MQDGNNTSLPMKTALKALNKNAALFSRKLLSKAAFTDLSKTQLRHFLYTGLIDRIEARILLEQTLDIANNDSFSFQDPENFMPKVSQKNLE